MPPSPVSLSWKDTHLSLGCSWDFTRGWYRCSRLISATAGSLVDKYLAACLCPEAQPASELWLTLTVTKKPLPNGFMILRDPTLSFLGIIH